MTVKAPNWGNGDHERRQHIAQELQQLKQMSKSLRTKAMRAFMKRTEADRPAVKRRTTPVKPPAVAA